MVKTEVKTDKNETSVPILYQLERDLEKVIKNYVEEETTLIGCLFFGYCNEENLCTCAGAANDC